jgi:hypothetical protein
MPKERKPSAPKLTRQQVKDGLDYIPIDTLLLGKVKGEQSLSHKQKEFARLVALGETKTGSPTGRHTTARVNQKGKQSQGVVWLRILRSG